MKYRVVAPGNPKFLPEDFELSAAYILLGYFKADIVFVERAAHKTPDIEVGGVRWEIKSPLGKSNRNIQHQLERAKKQSVNIIIDARRSKRDMGKIIAELARVAKTSKTIRRLLLITKSGKVIEFRRK